MIAEEYNEVSTENDNNNRTELTKLEVELCKQNFQSYDKQRQGYVETFELPMVLTGKASFILIIFIACGYNNLEESKLQQLYEFIEEKNANKIDVNLMIMVLTQLKEIELMHEAENDTDEYCK